MVTAGLYKIVESFVEFEIMGCWSCPGSECPEVGCTGSKCPEVGCTDSESDIVASV